MIYQIYPRSFADANGDGVGDLRGIVEHLDYLNDGTDDSLGVAAIWLSPFYRSPMADFGYDISDYTDVDPVFGTLADFDDLLAGAHRRGVKVIVDWVPNHTSDQHPWFVESASSRDSAKRDWYVWRDPAPDGGPPNNWRSEFRAVGPAWTFHEPTGQYYLHSFTPHQPDLNWDNPAVEAAMHDVLRFWLDRGADGFRIDVVYKLAKDPEFRDNEPDLRHDQDWPTIHDRLRRIRAVVEDVRRAGARRRGLPAGPAPRGGVHQHGRRAGPGPQLRLRPPALAGGGVRGVGAAVHRPGRGGGLAGLVPGEPRPLAGRDAVRRRPGKRTAPRPGGRHDDLRAARHPVPVLRAGTRAARCRHTAGPGGGRRRQGPGAGARCRGGRRPGPDRAPASPPGNPGSTSSPTPTACAWQAQAKDPASTLAFVAAAQPPAVARRANPRYGPARRSR